MKIKHILIDMDGVLADFVAHFLNTFDITLAGPWPKGEFMIGKVLGYSESKIWSMVESRGAEYWETMPKTDFADELISYLSALCVPMTISTSPSLDPMSVVGKIKWLRKNVPTFKHHQLMIGGNKTLFAKPGVVLIDDHDKNLDLFAAAGGYPVPIPQPWNRYHGEPMSLVADLLEKLEDV